MRVVTSAEIDRVLTFPALIGALAEAFRGDMVTPVRHHHEIERSGAHGTLLLMPSWTGPAMQDGFIGVKIVSVFPENGAKSLPSVMGSYLLMDGVTGSPVAVLDGTRLTVWRTAAASALAARHLAREDASRMVMVGAGSLAPFLIRAHMSQRPIREVALWNHNLEKAENLAAGLRAEGLPVTAVADLEAAVHEADLVSCATLSNTPIVRGAWLKAGVHLDLVGAFNLRMREADDDALRRAQVYIDTPAAKSEGGDVAVSLQSGAIAESHVLGTLTDLCQAPPRRDPAAITTFKSVGAALEDLAAAMLVWRSLAKA
ncbi:ornithine cyclodeaminase family protein [Microvirga sp. 3-52]|uniref:ornithine cyclodeaminase family protein n=1 Tax=Microvirga sp. 3-52 TaxID=2792425 RepID=UPI001AC5AF07|nr:ornithine cyclodeaminase family protein [Microvirga sp. 3-52]MBO1906771.1 ornithine cyclodeaminase family protein [Microvirga sp. 3-52]MBS7453874.1 ornithine cyclodeaminase family protein [Microvirga sp. 3-52]